MTIAYADAFNSNTTVPVERFQTFKTNRIKELI